MRLARLSVLALAATSCLPVLAQSSSTGADNMYLNGQYAFLLKGVAPKSTASQPVLSTLIGTFVADGNGNVTSGVAFINSPTVTMNKMSINGSYVVNNDGTGSMTLNTPLGTVSFVLSVAANLSATIDHGLATQLANPTGAGVFHLQNTSSFAYTTTGIPTSGQFLVNLSGETACNSTCQASSFPVNATVQGTAQVQLNQSSANSGGSITLPVTVTAGTSTTNTVITGTFSQAGTLGGRLLTVNGTNNLGITQFALWQYDYNAFYMMSLDPHSSAPLVAGSVGLIQ